MGSLWGRFELVAVAASSAPKMVSSGVAQGALSLNVGSFLSLLPLKFRAMGCIASYPCSRLNSTPYRPDIEPS